MLKYHIVGPNAGKTIRVTEFGVPFIEGVATLPRPGSREWLDNLDTSMERGWNAFRPGTEAARTAVQAWEARCGSSSVPPQGDHPVGCSPVDGGVPPDGSVADETADSDVNFGDPETFGEEPLPVTQDGSRPELAPDLSLRHTRVRKVVLELPMDDDACWTKGGLPDLGEVARRVQNGYLTRKDINIAAPEVRRIV